MQQDMASKGEGGDGGGGEAEDETGDRTPQGLNKVVSVTAFVYENKKIWEWTNMRINRYLTKKLAGLCS